ncbi:MAG: hypothetical protein WA771_13780 [Chthoniobacterales bacterium]
MPEFSQFAPAVNLGILAVAAIIIGVFGWRLASTADKLADATGLGEAIAGAILLGAATSLPGIITSAVTAWDGLPQLSVSNAVGGIAAQTAFLAIADITYKRANLEHAAASAPNILQAALLVTLLSVPLIATTGPDVTFLGIHPATPILFGAYIYGMHLVKRAHEIAPWKPQQTKETREDEGDDQPFEGKTSPLWISFGVNTVIVGIAGFVVARTGTAVALQTGLSETAVGGFLTAVSTSLPELVTSIAAVRQGALTLAVAGIIGGNCFDTLFLAVADIAYRPGSIYHHISDSQSFLMGLTIFMISVLLMGLIRREKRGIANIGFESFVILLVYVGAVVFMFTSE